MRTLTKFVTLLALITGTLLVCSQLMVIFVGLLLGPILLAPLIVNFGLAARLHGSAAQRLLLASTLLYFGYFLFVFYLREKPDGTFNLGALVSSWPLTLAVWVAALAARVREQRPP